MKNRLIPAMVGILVLAFAGQVWARDFDRDHDRDWDHDRGRDHDRGHHYYEDHRGHSFLHFYYYSPDYTYYYRDYPVYTQSPAVYSGLSVIDIVNMATRGLPDDAIINEIIRTRSSFNLTSEIVAYLKNNRVSDRVIDFMLTTGSSGSAS
ncbi:MAG: hypothetical protein PHG40_04680 [Candidatus Omnitrophica bacterium]|nr:hypothetical protein [Candidatus Omnitrophota bacterium]